MSFLNFFSMSDNYDDRKVDNTVDKGADGYEFQVDTASVSDGAHDYETAIAHPLYNDNKWVIVEAYDTIFDAKAGHARWIEKMKNEKPETIVDCLNSGVSQLLYVFDSDALTFKRENKKGDQND